MGLTRRRFVARAGLAVATLGAAGVWQSPTGAQVVSSRRTVGNVLRKGVALGPGGAGDSQQYRVNRRFFDETETPWVRLWADWPVLQPEPGVPPDRGSGAAALARLDAGIEGARADGRRVMLTAWRFPRWANDTDWLSPVRDISFEIRDRVAIGGDPLQRKDLTFRLPQDLSPGSEWGSWIDFLIGRYADSIDALELLNEPNLQLWPQTGVADAVARMFVTAQTVAGRHLGAPLLVGPATADPVGDSRLRTGYDTFTRELLDQLDARGFRAGPGFAWSHHSYADLEGELRGQENRTATARAMLVGRWAGWPAGDAAAPELLVTETGARLDRIAKLYGLGGAAAARQKQAELIERYWRLMQFGPEGAGVGMVCQYLFVTDMHYDAGLCDLDGTPRPGYRAWGRLPAFS
jgi:hypothetical protein